MINSIISVIALGGAIVTTFAIVKYNNLQNSKDEKKKLLAQMMATQYHMSHMDSSFKSEIKMSRNEIMDFIGKIGATIYAGDLPISEEDMKVWIETSVALHTLDDETLMKTSRKLNSELLKINKDYIDETNEKIDETNRSLKRTSNFVIFGFIMYVFSLALAIFEFVDVL